MFHSLLSEAFIAASSDGSTQSREYPSHSLGYYYLVCYGLSRRIVIIDRRTPLDDDEPMTCGEIRM
jgi:hypothetical protein